MIGWTAVSLIYSYYVRDNVGNINLTWHKTITSNDIHL
jgi:hypothetical protein